MTIELSPVLFDDEPKGWRGGKVTKPPAKSARKKRPSINSYTYRLGGDVTDKALRTLLEELGCVRCREKHAPVAVVKAMIARLGSYGTNDKQVWLYLQARAGRSCYYSPKDNRVHGLPDLNDKMFLYYNSIWERNRCDEQKVWLRLSYMQFSFVANDNTMGFKIN